MIFPLGKRLITVCSLSLLWFIFRALTGAEFFIPPSGTLFRYLMFAPVVEEIVFRMGLMGYLLGHDRLTGKIIGISGANLLVSILFSLVHAGASGWVHAVLVFVPSLLFGWVFEERRKLSDAIAVHAFANLNVFLV